MKKIFGIIIAFSVLFSAGSIYAKVDSAANFSNWYENSFQKESGRLGATTAAGIWTNANHVRTFVSESKIEIDSSIESFRDEQVRKVIAGILEFRDDNKSRLEQTVTDLKQENFDDYVENVNIEETVDQDIKNILEDVLSE